MKSKIGISMMIAGCLSIMAAVCIAGMNIFSDVSSGKKSADVLSVLENQIENQNQNLIYTENIAEESLKTLSVGDNTFTGIISIPEIGVELPVMSSWSYENLDVSPCLYYEDPGKKVIAAHNYSSHFGRIKELVSGDYIFFTDTRNNITMYEVITTEILNSHDTEKMISGDEWDMTLFTCTLSGTQRVTVRAREISDFKNN